MISERSLYLHFLRIFSALLVCMGHAKEFFISHSEGSDSFLQSGVRAELSLGGSSVLVFFFLSGYLVGGNEISRAINGDLFPRKYFLDRFTRLWQVLIPALLLTRLLNYLSCKSRFDSLYCSADVSLASHAFSLPMESQSLKSFFGSIFFLHPFRGDVFGGNGPLWSLSYEFWYYIIFYSFLMMILGRKRKLHFHEYLIAILLLLIGCRILSLNWVSLSFVWLAGAAASQIIYELEIRNVRIFVSSFLRKIMFYFSCLCVFVAMNLAVILPRQLSYPILTFTLTASIFFTGNSNSLSKKKFVIRSVIRGSEMSFSLYLTHFPLLAFVSTQVTPFTRWELNLNSMALLLASTILSVSVAYIFATITEFRLGALRRKLDFLYKTQKPS